MSDEPGCTGCPAPFPQVAADAAPGPSTVRAAASISEATSALEERPANIAARIRLPVPAGRLECHPRTTTSQYINSGPTMNITIYRCLIHSMTKCRPDHRR